MSIMLPSNALVREVAPAGATASVPKLVGRSRELEKLEDLLSEDSLSTNIFLVGERGVGIRTLIEHLALKLRASSGGTNREILELDLTELRGKKPETDDAVTEFLERVSEGSGSCLYVEDFETIFQSPSKNAQHFYRVVNLIRTKKLFVIGTLTSYGLAWLRRSEPKVVRHSVILEIKALSSRNTLKILQDRKNELCSLFSLDISLKAIRAAVYLSRDALPKHPLPGAALDVLHKACSRHATRQQLDSESSIQVFDSSTHELRSAEVSHYDVKRIVEEISSLEFSEEKAQSLSGRVSARLAKVIVGQDEALKGLSRAVGKITTDFGNLPRPSGLLMLLGSRGTGKTFALRTLAEMLLHDEHDMAVYDLRKYPTDSSIRGLFGLNDESSVDSVDLDVGEATRRSAISLLVFKHFSAAPPHFFQIIETILTTGTYRTASGSRVDLRRSILVLTDDLHQWEAPGTGQLESDASYAEILVPPKVAHSLDAVIHFRDLNEEDYMELIKRQVNAFRREFGNAKPKCRIHRAVLDRLIRSAQDSNAGAEDLITKLEEQIFIPGRSILQQRSALDFIHLRVTLESNKIRVQLDAPAESSSQHTERES